MKALFPMEWYSMGHVSTVCFKKKMVQSVPNNHTVLLWEPFCYTEKNFLFFYFMIKMSSY